MVCGRFRIVNKLNEKTGGKTNEEDVWYPQSRES
jgi:hypothetical protein